MKKLFTVLITFALFFFIVSSTSVWASSVQRVEFLYDQLIQASSFKARIAAAQELGKISNGSMAPYLEQAFENEDEEAVRISILEAMAHIPDQKIIQSLLYICFHHVLSAQEQQVIKVVLWNHRQSFLISEWALHAFSSPYDKQRAMAFWILSIVGDKQVLPFLIKGIEDQSPIVLKRLAMSLQEFPSVETKQACQSLVNSSIRSVQSMGHFCIKSIDYRLKKTYTPSFKKTMANVEKMHHSISPKVIAAYFDAKQSDMKLDHAYAPMLGQTQKVKNLTFQSQEEIAATTIESYMTSQKNYKQVDIAVIKAFIAEKFPMMQGCYENRLSESPDLKVDLTITFTINPSGTPAKTKITDQSFEDRLLNTCIIERFNELQFPKTEKTNIQAQYTFHFIPPKKRVYIYKAQN